MGVKRQNGLYGKIVDLLNSNPKKLYTVENIVKEFKVKKEAANNGLYNMHRAGRIMRHVEKTKDKEYRYAFSIPAGLHDTYMMKTPNKTSKKTQLPTSKEIRTMFAQTQNQMAKMEDMMIAVVEKYEELDKMINKIKNLTQL